MLWMRSARSSIRVSAFLALLVLAGASGLAQDVTGTFVPIVVPGATFTAARVITADGRVVGFFSDATGQHGFLLADGNFTTIDVPVARARSTNVFGINASGDIVGSWIDSGGVQHGFHWPAHGPFNFIDGPGTIRTLARGSNATGDIVGYYDTPDKRHGFLLRRDGVFTTIDLNGTQGPPPNGTFTQWINAAAISSARSSRRRSRAARGTGRAGRARTPQAVHV